MLVFITKGWSRGILIALYLLGSLVGRCLLPPNGVGEQQDQHDCERCLI